jgi:hypothetical protein
MKEEHQEMTGDRVSLSRPTRLSFGSLPWLASDTKQLNNKIK